MPMALLKSKRKDQSKRSNERAIATEVDIAVIGVTGGTTTTRTIKVIEKTVVIVVIVKTTAIAIVVITTVIGTAVIAEIATMMMIMIEKVIEGSVEKEAEVEEGTSEGDIAIVITQTINTETIVVPTVTESMVDTVTTKDKRRIARESIKMIEADYYDLICLVS